MGGGGGGGEGTSLPSPPRGAATDKKLSWISTRRKMSRARLFSFVFWAPVWNEVRENWVVLNILRLVEIHAALYSYSKLTHSLRNTLLFQNWGGERQGNQCN